MAEPTYSLRTDAEAFFRRVVDEHCNAPKTLTDLAKAALRLGDLDDAQLALHRTYLRRLRKLIDTAIAIGEGHANDHRKAAQAKCAAAESDAPAAAEADHE